MDYEPFNHKKMGFTKKTRILPKKAGFLGRKAGFLDFIYIIAALFIAAIAIVVSYVVVSIADSTNVFDSDPGGTYAMEQATKTAKSFDNMILFVIVGLSLFVLIGSAMVYHHPAFFIVGIIMLIISVVVAAGISNAFYLFTEQPVISTASLEYPKIVYLMNHLPLYIAFMGIASSIAMYTSFKRE